MKTLDIVFLAACKDNGECVSELECEVALTSTNDAMHDK